MKMTLNIKGMGCEGCVKTVSRALKGVPGVTNVEVTLAQGRAVVESGAATTKEQLIAAVVAEGYKAEVAAH